MRTFTRLIAALDLVLILPAGLFLTALAVRSLPALQYEPANIAEQIVLWYSERMWTLWVLLLALPLAVLLTGGTTLLGGWICGDEREHSSPQSRVRIDAIPETILVALTTLTAAVILTIVVLHMLAN